MKAIFTSVLAYILAYGLFKFSGQLDTEEGIDEYIDEFLRNLSIRGVAEGWDDIAIPNVNQTVEIPLTQNWAPLADVDFYHGSFKNLSTLIRTSNATIKKENITTTLGVSLGLEEIMVNFDYFKFKLLFLYTDGPLKARVVGSSTYFEASLMYDEKNDICRVTLDKLEIQKIGQWDAHLGDNSFYHRVKSKFISIFLTAASYVLRGQASYLLNGAVQSQMDAVSDMICYKIQHNEL